MSLVFILVKNWTRQGFHNCLNSWNITWGAHKGSSNICCVRVFSWLG